MRSARAERVRAGWWAACSLLLGLLACSSPDAEPRPEQQPDASVAVDPRAGSDGEPQRPPLGSGEKPPPDASGGQSGEGGGPLDSCMAERWTGLDQPRLRAACVQVFPAPGVPHSYRCDCDSDGAAPSTETPVVSDGGIADPSVIEAASCDQALRATCGLSGRYIGFCERSSAWKSEPLVCFEQPGQGFLCHCPNLDEPVLHADPDCEGALRRACAGDCESAAGSCTVSGKNHYTCQCAIGIAGEIEDPPLCEDALHWWCDPACENPRGACYWQPDGKRIVCQCAGDPELHVTAPDPNVTGDECHTPLERFCGK